MKRAPPPPPRPRPPARKRARKASRSVALIRLPAPRAPARSSGVRPAATAEIDALRREVENLAKRGQAPRWSPDPEDVQRSVVRLVLSLVEFLRCLMERQALRRMEEGTLTDEEIEQIGVALMRLEETVHALAARFGLAPEELNLDLGPLGKLM